MATGRADLPSGSRDTVAVLVKQFQRVSALVVHVLLPDSCMQLQRHESFHHTHTACIYFCMYCKCETHFHPSLNAFTCNTKHVFLVSDRYCKCILQLH